MEERIYDVSAKILIKGFIASNETEARERAKDMIARELGTKEYGIILMSTEVIEQKEG